MRDPPANPCGRSTKSSPYQMPSNPPVGSTDHIHLFLIHVDSPYGSGYVIEQQPSCTCLSHHIQSQTKAFKGYGQHETFGPGMKCA